ncbi:type IV secretion protein Rhs [Nostoc sp. 'Peltigera membranacea cyanobiont' 213]|uniref:VgrG-related protein n=1 Tax=unclassified Nostoc TaxID=2593658 RepID=UPI000B95B4C9|nr:MULTISPECIES: VgrG-related protein [unclassified Nostoc]AVH62302.1 type IV secretion protein Rhs [Nostoc sp. 'Peltigera membranacea cyanobiont' N6]OYD88278.1 type IV secretion protein Rhs [Nostoc sp. 'Peltigera membranacea cyanobiont' 213]
MTKESLYLSQPKVQIEGLDDSSELMKDLVQITIEESLHLPAMFTLVVHNSYLPTSERSENKPWRYEQVFKIGKKVKLGFSGSTTQDPNFKKDVEEDFLMQGEITAMEVHFNDKSEADIIVRGYDISHRLHRGRYNRSFLNETDSDIVKKVVKQVGIKLGNIESTSEVHKYVFQENQTNMEFLRERAARIGFELFITEDKINFCNPKVQGSLSLKWLVNISKFSTRVTSAEQVSSVEVRAWDYSQKRLISQIAKKEKQVTETGNKLGSSTSTAFSNLNSPKMTVVDKPVTSENQAKAMAQALCDELGGEFVYADAKATGNPEIRPGRVINLEGMGDRYSGKYYVTETRHFFNQRVYETDFSVRGLRSGNLFTTLSPEKRLQPSETLLVGIVTDNKDPEKMGRVKVKFPTLTEDHTSDWARVVAVGAGQNRGFDCLPEVNDEVLVGFEHGDIHRPYVIGGVWNGKDAPPEKVGDSVTSGVRLRTIKTRVGHVLQFVEEDKGSSKTGIRVETKDGHKIYLNDSQRCIEIETKGGHRIKMDDMAKSVSVKSTGNMSLDAAGNIDISANGTITVKGALIRLN